MIHTFTIGDKFVVMLFKESNGVPTLKVGTSVLRGTSEKDIKESAAEAFMDCLSQSNGLWFLSAEMGYDNALENFSALYNLSAEEMRKIYSGLRDSTIEKE